MSRVKPVAVPRTLLFPNIDPPSLRDEEEFSRTRSDALRGGYPNPHQLTFRKNYQIASLAMLWRGARFPTLFCFDSASSHVSLRADPQK